MSIRNSRFESAANNCYQAGVPVISVGNLTTGGTGKTPLVRWICRNIRDRWGLRVGLLSRGYQKGDQAINDEALELEWSLPDVPHLQDPDRSKMAAVAVEELESECLVLDDAFQHRKIHRDLDIVVIDATNPFGYGYCLPRGLLREPVSGLKRASAILISRCDQVSADKLSEIRQTVQKHCSPEVPVALAVHRPVGLIDFKGNRQPLDSIQGKNVLSFCGIGNPSAFDRTLQSTGCKVLDSKFFPDHHLYQQEDLQGLIAWSDEWEEKQESDIGQEESKKDCQFFGVLTTVKDLVKVAIPRVGSVPLWAVEVQLEFLEGESAFLELLGRHLPDNDQ